MKALFTMTMLAVVLFSTVLPAIADTSTDTTLSTAERTVIGKKAAEKIVGRRRPFTIRERREMGATFSNVKRIMEDLQAEGTLDSDPANAMFQVMEILKAENPKGWSEAESLPPEEIDWDKLFEFLERLIAFIMTLFS